MIKKIKHSFRMYFFKQKVNGMGGVCISWWWNHPAASCIHMGWFVKGYADFLSDKQIAMFRLLYIKKKTVFCYMRPTRGRDGEVVSEHEVFKIK